MITLASLFLAILCSLLLMAAVHFARLANGAFRYPASLHFLGWRRLALSAFCASFALMVGWSSYAFATGRYIGTSTTATKPTCTEGRRGVVWLDFNSKSPNNVDQLEVCATTTNSATLGWRGITVTTANIP